MTHVLRLAALTSPRADRKESDEKAHARARGSAMRSCAAGRFGAGLLLPTDCGTPPKPGLAVHAEPLGGLLRREKAVQHQCSKISVIRRVRRDVGETAGPAHRS